MPKTTHSEPHAAAFKTLGASPEIIARMQALGINWGQLVLTLLTDLLPVLEGLDKTTPPA